MLVLKGNKNKISDSLNKFRCSSTTDTPNTNNFHNALNASNAFKNGVKNKENIKNNSKRMILEEVKKNIKINVSSVLNKEKFKIQHSFNKPKLFLKLVNSSKNFTFNGERKEKQREKQQQQQQQVNSNFNPIISLSPNHLLSVSSVASVGSPIENPRNHFDFNFKFYHPNLTNTTNPIHFLKSGDKKTHQSLNTSTNKKVNSINRMGKLLDNLNLNLNLNLNQNNTSRVNKSVSNYKSEIILNTKMEDKRILSEIDIRSSIANKNKSVLSPRELSGSLNKDKFPSIASIHNTDSRNLSYYTSVLNSKCKKYENAKFGTKSTGWIESYGANTNQGRIRNYNEDRVSVIYNVLKPNSRKDEKWPVVSFFGIYDGHAGSKCSDFLKENLHQYIFRQACFPSDPVKAINKGFEEAERNFVALVKPVNCINDYNRSGSCAIIIIIMDDNCYVANVGDSRALLSENGGKRSFQVTRDHKPNDPDEKGRVAEAGGYIYQTNAIISREEIFDAPWRIFPGKLSVSRAIGDIEAKIPELGGNPKVLIATPDVVSFKIKFDTDFIILGSDGIFDKLSNEEIFKSIWASGFKGLITDNIHKQSGKVTDLVMKSSLVNYTKMLFDSHPSLKDDYIVNIVKSIDCNVNTPYKPNENIKPNYQIKEDQNDSDQSEDLEDINISKLDSYRITQKKLNICNSTISNSITLKTLSNLPSFKIEANLYSYDSLKNKSDLNKAKESNKGNKEKEVFKLNGVNSPVNNTSFNSFLINNKKTHNQRNVINLRNINSNNMSNSSIAGIKDLSHRGNIKSPTNKLKNNN